MYVLIGYPQYFSENKKLFRKSYKTTDLQYRKKREIKQTTKKRCAWLLPCSMENTPFYSYFKTKKTVKEHIKTCFITYQKVFLININIVFLL